MKNLSMIGAACTAVLFAGWCGAGQVAAAQEKSVKPGINRQFENPDPSVFVERFEREGREVFDYRHEIVEACRFRPGHRIADIGAGTGLFTRMFAPRVGAAGRVYAVDISKNFVDHIVESCAARGIENVVGVVCKPDSVELPADSVDAVFICDTYHHFEYPQKTLRSIHDALRQGGELILVDFDRIEGVSSAWILDHMRADRQTFADEIVAAGFRFVEELPLMRESYFLRFAKLSDGESRPALPVALPSYPLRGKRVIQWGWGEPDTRFMRENIERMEQMPFDGLVFHVTSSRGGNFVWEMWGGRKFERSEFDGAVADLQATPFRRLAERFLRVNVTPGAVDWFDDEAWQGVLHNVGVAADVARAGRAKGFMFDVEQYQTPLFDYRKQPQRDTKSFDQYRDQVRRRGREWIERVNGSFPDITILLTFGYSITQPRGESADRSESTYGLLADFLDGMIEACSDRTMIVDAWETSYPYKLREQFVEAYRTIRERSADWSADADRYRRFVRAGFGLWMDYNWRKLGWDIEDLSKNHFTPAEFERSLQAALQASDGYVWVYTEQPRWWTNERLPQPYIDAVANGRAPRP